MTLPPATKKIQRYTPPLWHGREHGVKLAGGLKLERLPQMLKGLRRVYGEQPRAIRRGIAPQALKRAFDLVLDPGVRLSTLELDGLDSLVLKKYCKTRWKFWHDLSPPESHASRESHDRTSLFVATYDTASRRNSL